VGCSWDSSVSSPILLLSSFNQAEIRVSYFCLPFLLKISSRDKGVSILLANFAEDFKQKQGCPHFA